MTPRPERWYRLLTLAYPRRWRRQHADELVGSLLDLADQEGRRRPAPRDVLDVVAHGLACRARTPVDALPARTRSVAATLGLASGAAVSLVLLAVGDRPDPTASVGPVVYGGWLLALVAALTGPGRAVLAATTAVGAAVPVIAHTRPSLWILGFLTLCGLLALLAPRGRPAVRDLLLPTAVAAALVAGPLLAYRQDGTLADGSFYYGGPRLALALSALLVITLLVAAAVVLVVRGSRDAGAGAALAALPWLVLGLLLLEVVAPAEELRPVLLGAATATLLGTFVFRHLGLRLRIERV